MRESPAAAFILRDGSTDGALARIHRSRVKAFRLRPAHDRSLHHPNVPTSVHPGVRDRYEGDAGYRPKNLLDFLGSRGGRDEVVDA